MSRLVLIREIVQIVRIKEVSRIFPDHIDCESEKNSDGFENFLGEHVSRGVF